MPNDFYVDDEWLHVYLHIYALRMHNISTPTTHTYFLLLFFARIHMSLT